MSDKKYEAVLEAAFELVEAEKAFSGMVESASLVVTEQICKMAFQNLKKSVGALQEFRVAQEPVFILRGRDRAAPQTLRAWSTFAEKEGATMERVDNALRISKKMRDWQEANPLLTKVPD